MITHPCAVRRGRLAIAARMAAMIGLATALSGCYTGQDYTRPQLPDGYPTDYRLRHPIAIKESVRTVQILVGTRRGELLAGQRADVLAFAHAWHREATGGVVIELPSGTPNERMASEMLHEIRSILVSASVPQSSIDLLPYRPAIPIKLATIRLTYPRMAAQAGPCGLWPRDLGPSFQREHEENREYWNLGCAHQRALAAMVDDPSDLIQPRADDPVYAARRTTVLDKYRKGETTVTTDPNANKGKISDLGQ
ncbi:MAG TPA: CpaD family pilus assembly protein [Xanthobacteraceae bacterium]|jgi:pilus assembly protein CpaD|nr:CpaD family pilus assembly protein [Xanthobacteraceae bacterium]